MRGRNNAEARAQLRDKPIEMIQMQDFSDFEINIDMDEDEEEEEEEGRIYTQDLPLHLRVEAPDLQVVPEEESDISLHEC